MDSKAGEYFKWILRTLLLFLYCLLSKAGDKMVRLQEGTNITLHTGITGIPTDSQIQWFYGPEKAEEKILFSHVFRGETVTDMSERVKERLQLDRISGDLTIRNISRNDSGAYLVQVLTGRLSAKTFSVRVYAPVSAPVIIKQREDRSVSSTEPCFLLCSVENGEDVKLSWYRENEKISITNNSNLSVPLSVPLQLRYRENDSNTYSCVSHNPVSSKTTSLHITQLCNFSSGEKIRSRLLTPALISAVLLLVIIIVTLWIHQRKTKHQGSEAPDDLTYADVTITAHSGETLKEYELSRRTDAEADGEPVVYSEVKT